jgi:hypothetical protein
MFALCATGLYKENYCLGNEVDVNSLATLQPGGKRWQRVRLRYVQRSERSLHF